MRKIIFSVILSLWSLHSVAQYDIKLHQVDSNIYIYTSYGDVGNYKNIDANAAIVISGDEAILFDTPWDTRQAEQLLKFIREDLKKEVKLSIITHAHVDRIGSIEMMFANSIPTLSYYLTAEQAPKHGHPTPALQFYGPDTTIQCGNLDIVAYYPGAGHTVDNIVLYVPAKGLLYGGCFIKSGKSGSIGNIKDADVAEWPESIARMQERFEPGRIKMVIPGHGSWESDKAIENTLMLLTKEVESKY